MQVQTVVVDLSQCTRGLVESDAHCKPFASWCTVLTLPCTCVHCRLVYNPDRVPKTAEEWNNFPFVDKTHTGFYSWPK